jgi:putative membrane protein
MKTHVLLAAAAVLAATPALAQSSMSPPSSSSMSHGAADAAKGAANGVMKLDPNSARFIHTAGIANTFEIQSSQLALQKSSNADVKQFAQQMIDDHTKAGAKLAGITKDDKMPAPPTQLDAKHKKIMGSLQEKSGASFDSAYIQAQTKAHHEAVNLFSKYGKSGENPDLKKFASTTLPTLQSHLQHVERLSGVAQSGKGMSSGRASTGGKMPMPENKPAGGMSK